MIDVLGLQRRIRAFEHADDVGRVDRLALERRLRAERAGQRETRQRLPVGDELIELVERVAAAGEDFVGAARGQRDRDRLPGLRPSARDRRARWSAAACSRRARRAASPAPLRGRRGRRAASRRRCAGGAADRARRARSSRSPIAPAFFSTSPPLAGGVDVRLARCRSTFTGGNALT